jgi:glycine/D-amino acid oxidase-like deaminating enzyme
VEVEIDPQTSGLIHHALIHAPEIVEFRNPHQFEYIVPIHDAQGRFGTGRFILGGTIEPASDSELFLEQTPDEKVGQEILDKCARIVPSLRFARITGQRVGIRPCRSGGIRIERESRFSDLPIIAAYGAGSDGISLHGCMLDAVQLVESALTTS